MSFNLMFNTSVIRVPDHACNIKIQAIAGDSFLICSYFICIATLITISLVQTHTQHPQCADGRYTGFVVLPCQNVSKCMTFCQVFQELLLFSFVPNCKVFLFNVMGISHLLKGTFTTNERAGGWGMLRLGAYPLGELLNAPPLCCAQPCWMPEKINKNEEAVLYIRVQYITFLLRNEVESEMLYIESYVQYMNTKHNDCAACE